MANRTKQRRNQGLMLSLYQRVPHPEFFRILASEQVTRRAYDADIWLVEGGHVVSFAVGRIALAEACVHAAQPVQDRGLTQSILCRGERYHETTVEDTIKYMISTQEEQLNQALYDATRSEIQAYAAKRELMTAETPATADCGAALSVLDVERRSHELLIQSFHLFDDSLTVIKTQGIFEVLKRD
jgi:Protein of unknown function DUF2617